MNRDTQVRWHSRTSHAILCALKSSFMGCVCMKVRQNVHEDPTLLASQTYFSVKEVKALHELHRKLSSSIVDDGFISKEEFRLGIFRNSKMESIFADWIFTLFDSNNDGVIDFAEFVKSLSIFHPDAPQIDKVIFTFKLYDILSTGFIEPDEVKEMILGLLRESDLTLSDDLIEAIIQKTFEEADTKRDGKIDLEEWKDLVARHPSLLKNMTIPYLKDITALPSFVQRTDIEDAFQNYL